MKKKLDRLQTENNSNNFNILCYPVFQINCFSMKLSLLMSFLKLIFFLRNESYGMKLDPFHCEMARAIACGLLQANSETISPFLSYLKP